MRVVALAASMGGLQALSVILRALPGDFPAPTVIVQHVSPEPRSELADLLSRRTALRVREAQQGDHLQAGWVYVAPSGRHLQVHPDGTLWLTLAEKVGLGRPSADLLFASLGGNLGGRAVAVVLTGTGRDGSKDVRAVRAAGGVTLAQDEAMSQFADMPRSAAATGCVNLVLPLDEFGPALVRLLGGSGVAERCASGADPSQPISLKESRF